MIRLAFVSLCLALGLASMFARPVSAREYCSIEIANDRKETASVLVTFDDGSTVHMLVYAHERPHYVSLFYHGYCHAKAHVRVALLPHHDVIYDRWTSVDSTVRLIPY